MTDLNLNFDTGIKSVTMGNSGGDNIAITPDNSLSVNNSVQQQSSPKLTVSDPAGIEFLAKGAQTPQVTSDNSPKSVTEEFNFFKPSEPEPS